MECSTCVMELSDSVRFCPSCGTPVAQSRADRDEERKLVTIVFCDIVDSTAMASGHDPELVRSLLLRYYQLMREQVEAFGGVVEKFIGDAVVAVFGLESTREDDAWSALRAALRMIESLSALNDETAIRHSIRIRLRIGVHTGIVVAVADLSGRQALITGEVVNTAARLQSAAGVDAVLASAQALQAAGPRVSAGALAAYRLKGIDSPIEAAQVRAVREVELLEPSRHQSPFVGRERDLELLDLVWARVTEERRVHLLTILGDAGIGKTRLASRWLESLDRQKLFVGVGTCIQQHDGSPINALLACVRMLMDAAEAEGLDPLGPGLTAATALIRGGPLPDGRPSPSLSEASAALGTALRVLADRRPLILMIDGLHWSDGPMVDAIEQVVGAVARLPVMLLCLARPELTEAHPGWGRAAADTLSVTMGGLNGDRAQLLASNLVGEVVAHQSVEMAAALERADGNPFYIEQIVTAVHQGDGRLESLPLTLHALISARIDSLDETARQTLRHAAVFDEDFGPEGLCEIDEALAGADCGQALEALVGKRLIDPVASTDAAMSYRFSNSLIRMAAYEGLTKRRRGELHTVRAKALATQGGSESRVGRHYLKAYQYHAEIGGDEGTASALRRDAVVHLAKAGEQALRQMDLARACEVLKTVVELAEPGAVRARALMNLGEAQLTMGRSAGARKLLEDAITEASRVGQETVAAHARLHLAVMRGDGCVLDAAEQAHRVFAAAGDRLGLIRCRLLLAQDRLVRGRFAEVVDLLEPALQYAESVCADKELANLLGALGMALYLGAEPVPTALGRCVELVEYHGADRQAVRATLGFSTTVLHAVNGEEQAASACLARTLEAMAMLGYPEAYVFQPLLNGLVLVAGAAMHQDESESRLEAARQHLAKAVAAAEALGDARLTMMATLELTRVNLALGAVDQVRGLMDGLSVPVESPVEVASLFGIKAVMAALDGDDAHAEALLGDASATARSTDSPATLALVLLDSAQVRHLAGRYTQAESDAQAAYDLFASKAHAVGMASARSQAQRARQTEVRS